MTAAASASSKTASAASRSRMPRRPGTRPVIVCARMLATESARSSGPCSMPMLCSRASGKTASLRQIDAAAQQERVGQEQEAVALPRQRAQQTSAARGVRVRILRLGAEDAVLEHERPLALGQARHEQAQHALDVGARADRQHGRELVVGAVGESATREAVDGDPPPAERPPQDRLVDLDGVHAARRKDLGDRREQAERDAHAARRRRDRVAQGARDRAHPVRAEADQRRDQGEQHPRSPRDRAHDDRRHDRDEPERSRC